MDFQLFGGVGILTPTLFKSKLYSLKIIELGFRTLSLMILTLPLNVDRSNSFPELCFLHLWNELLGFNQDLKMFIVWSGHMSKENSYCSASADYCPKNIMRPDLCFPRPTISTCYAISPNFKYQQLIQKSHKTLRRANKISVATFGPCTLVCNLQTRFRRFFPNFKMLSLERIGNMGNSCIMLSGSVATHVPFLWKCLLGWLLS